MRSIKQLVKDYIADTAIMAVHVHYREKEKERQLPQQLADEYARERVERDIERQEVFNKHLLEGYCKQAIGLVALSKRWGLSLDDTYLVTQGEGFPTQWVAVLTKGGPIGTLGVTMVHKAGVIPARVMTDGHQWLVEDIEKWENEAVDEAESMARESIVQSLLRTKLAEAKEPAKESC